MPLGMRMRQGSQRQPAASTGEIKQGSEMKQTGLRRGL